MPERPNAFDPGATVEHISTPREGQPAQRANDSEVDSSASHLEVRCPNCHQPTHVAVDTPLTDLTCGSCGSHFSLVDQSKATRMAPSLTKLGRFELIERLGVGGFGSVWKARDKELDRAVAIKIPRAGGMTGEDQDKFFREARTVAQLHHPNIVSVHEVGRDGESVYIVSDFVRGVTLSDWLTGQQLTSREAAELCATIADALDHAHENGVVHRDLKPANIMMDYDGRPHLMDFGLARRESGEVTMTIDGQVLGTPAYMSPEQAQGDAHTADRRSDVYSLGVILFQLLTNELPFRGNARMLIKQVIHDEPPSPRKLSGNVSKDMETITLKCLEKDPSRRFQSARELGNELNRFLAGEPIQSRPISRTARSWRWTKRNPRVALLTASVAVLLVTIAALSLVGLAIAKRQQIAAQEAAKREAGLREYAQQSAAREGELRKLAEQNLATAEQAVDGYLTRVAEDQRLKQGDFHKLRTELLETAVPFYERFAKQKAGDAESESDRAKAHARLASIHGEMGKPDRSAKEYAEAIAIQRALVSKFPDRPEYKQDLAELETQLGWNLNVVGDIWGAKPHYEAAIATLRKLTERYPDKPEYQHSAARAHEKFGVLLRSIDINLARAQFEQAIKIEQKLLASTPKVADYETTYASSSFYLGHGFVESNPNLAREHLSEAAKIQRNLLIAKPKDPEIRSALAESIAYLGAAQFSLTEAASGRKNMEEAIKIQEQVVAEFPSVLKYRVILSGIQFSYGNCLERINAKSDALHQYENRAVARERMLVDFPDVEGDTLNAASGYAMCAELATQLKDLSAARAYFERAVAVAERQAAEAPDSDHRYGNTALIHEQFAHWFFKQRDFSNGLSHNRIALQIFLKLEQKRPDFEQFQVDIVDLHHASAMCAEEIDWPAAMEHYEELIKRLEKLVADVPDNVDYRNRLASVANGLARKMATSQDEKKRDGKRAVELARRACELTNDQDSAMISTLAAAYAEAGDFESAIHSSEKSLELFERDLKKQSPTTIGWLESVLVPNNRIAKDRQLFVQSLANYKAKKPTRDERHPAAVDSDAFSANALPVEPPPANEPPGSVPATTPD